jgi:3-oxoadipate enol-lactonase
VPSKYFTPMPGRIIKTNGTELYVVEKGSGPVLLLLHGLGWSHALWGDLLEKLSERYRLIAGDSRGHGLSAKPPGPYSMDQMTADWVGVLNAAGINRFSVVGLSQGGMIAMRLAVTLPERVSALGLLATTSYFSEQEWAAMEERGKVALSGGPRAAAEHTAKAIFSKQFATENRGIISEFVDNRMAASMVGLRGAMAALRGFDVRSALPVVRCPALVMHGTADLVISPESAQQTVKLLPHADHVMVDGAGHILPVERPESVLQQLSRFLDVYLRAEG